MVQLHSSQRITEFVEGTHVGHYLFMWKYPRQIWYRSKVPVYFDFGGETIWQFMRFNKRSPYCLKAVPKAQFISQNGGM